LHHVHRAHVFLVIVVDNFFHAEHGKCSGKQQIKTKNKNAYIPKNKKLSSVGSWTSKMSMWSANALK